MLAWVKNLGVLHGQAAFSSFTSLCGRPFSTIVTVCVIAMALTLPALFWVFSDNLHQITQQVRKGNPISLYLIDSTDATADKTRQQVEAMDGVRNVTLRTAEQGLQELQEQEGMQDIMRYLSKNPLPSLIEVIPENSMSNPDKIKILFEKLQALPTVDKAKLDMDWVTHLHAFLSFFKDTAQVLIALLAFAVILIVGNTLRIAVHNKYEEIQVLKLLGATNAFITRPYLYAGIWYGLLGALLAILFINIFLLSLALLIQQLAAVYHMHYPLLGLTISQAYSIFIAAMILGWVGAKFSIKKQLASVEALK